MQVGWTGDSRTIRIEIRDSGPGIPDETLAQIGTPFFTTRAEGTGLGVALARAVIAMHGGVLRYESGAGMGPTTVVELPCALPKELPDVARSAGG